MPYYRKLESGLWQATVRTPQGKRRTRTDPLKGVVKRWAEDAEAAMRRGEWADPKDGRITLAEWWEDWSKSRVIEYATTKRDESHWRTHVKPKWGERRIGTITAWDVTGWVAELSKDEKVGPSAAHFSVRLLRHMLSTAAEHKLIPTDPTATVKLPKIPKHVDRFLSPDEFTTLVDEMPTERDKAMVFLMCMAGLRWGEVAGLHAHRVDLKRSELTVVEVLRRDASVKKVPKSGAGQRIVPLVAELTAMLEPFVKAASVPMHEKPKPGEKVGLVFPDLDYSNWRRRVFVPAVLRAQLAGPLPTPHDLRHSFGSWLAERGVSPTDIMALMGHETLRSTERYLHAGDGRFARALTALGNARLIEA